MLIPDSTSQVRTYFAEPAAKSSDAAIVFVTDIFGMDFINSQLQADRFAQSLNAIVVVPDLFAGDPLPSPAQQKAPLDLPPWLERHGPESIDPIVERTIGYLREEKGVTRVGAVGYCFGAKVSHAFRAFVHIC